MVHIFFVRPERRAARRAVLGGRKSPWRRVVLPRARGRQARGPKSRAEREESRGGTTGPEGARDRAEVESAIGWFSASARLLSRFVAYQRALEAVALVERASRRWRGWASLVDQARRAGSSVVLNLAEGNAHPPGSKERRRFQRIALGSALELEAALDVAGAAGLGETADLRDARVAAGRSAAILVRLVAVP